MPEPATAATPATVHELATALALDEAAYARAVELAGLGPDRDDWRRWLDRFLMATGALLIIAGIAAFFAWNWADLHRMAKFALVQAGIVAAVLLAWRLQLDSTAGRAALFAGAFLVGVLLALFGQVYQTGADPYGLFLAWALLILPWAIAGRQAGLWLLFVVLLDLALILYWTQVLHPPDGWWQLTQLMGPLVWLGSTVIDSRLAGWVFALNAGALVAWEIAASRGVTWLQGRTAPRLLALAALYTVLAPTLLLIFAASAEEGLDITVLSPLLFAGALAACLAYYRYGKRDLFMLTAGVFGAILVVMALAIRHLFEEFQSLLVLALLLVALVGAAAWWLRQVARRWEALA
jgi:uncharacterized membrane protein